MRGQFRRRLIRYAQRRANWLRAVSVAISATILHWVVQPSPVGEFLDNTLLTFYYLTEPDREFPSEVILVALDQESYQREGISLFRPWPRRLLAEVVERLHDYGARRIILDITFQDPGENREENLLLAASLLRSGAFFMAGEVASVSVDLDGNTVQSIDSVNPIPELEANPHQLCPLVLSENGVVRHFYFDDRYGLPMVAALSGEELPVPLPGIHDFIRYYGPPGSIRSISLYRILRDTDRSLAPFVAGKTVFLGASSGSKSGLANRDSFFTPRFGDPIHGVEIHASIMANLLKGDWVRRAPPDIELGLLNLTAIVSITLLALFQPLRGFVFLLLLEVLFVTLGIMRFRRNLYLPGLLLFGVIVPAAFLLNSALLSGLRRRALRNMESALGIPLHKHVR